MMKSLYCSAALCLVMTSRLAAPANAMVPMICDAARMARMQLQMDAITHSAMKTNKDMDMKQMEMANTATKDNKTDECIINMGEAMNIMNKKHCSIKSRVQSASVV